MAQGHTASLEFEFAIAGSGELLNVLPQGSSLMRMYFGQQESASFQHELKEAIHW